MGSHENINRGAALREVTRVDPVARGRRVQQGYEGGGLRRES